MRIFLIFSFLITTGSVHAVDVPFRISMKLVAPIRITQTSNGLVFPDTPSESDARVTVAPQGSGAATFIICGEADKEICAVVVENSVDMRNGSSVIPVSSFKVDSTAKFDSAGNTTVKVGATAMVDASDVIGGYSGYVTLRIVYL